ncbi:hypothetical protein ACFLYV_04760 [Chloroflexota bacterium]
MNSTKQEKKTAGLAGQNPSAEALRLIPEAMAIGYCERAKKSINVL